MADVNTIWVQLPNELPEAIKTGPSEILTSSFDTFPKVLSCPHLNSYMYYNLQRAFTSILLGIRNQGSEKLSDLPTDIELTSDRRRI